MVKGQPTLDCTLYIVLRKLCDVMTRAGGIRHICG